MVTSCRFVDHQCRDLSRDSGMLIGTDVDNVLNEETAEKQEPMENVSLWVGIERWFFS
jgi:hypothetical protein